MGFTSDLQSPVVFPLVTTSYTVSINDGYTTNESNTSVNVNLPPVTNAGTDQTIPYGTSTTLNGFATGASGSYNFSWEPADLLINPSAQNTATQNLYQTTLFRLKATDATSGCVSLYDT